MQVLVPVFLPGCHIISNSLHSRLIEPLGLPFCLRTVDCSEIVSKAPFSAYRVEELGRKLLVVVDYNVKGRPTRRPGSPKNVAVTVDDSVLRSEMHFFNCVSWPVMTRVKANFRAGFV